MKFIIFIFLSISILAQDFEYPTASVQKAYKILTAGKDFYYFCNSCGDKSAKLKQIFSSGYSGKGSMGKIKANGEYLDLTSTYVKDGNEYKNLAKLSGISTDAPEILPADLIPRDTDASKISDINYLSVLEKSVLDELNLARTKPEEYATYLEEIKKHYKGNIYSEPDRIPISTQEGLKAVDEAIEVLKSMKPVSALTSSKGMSLAAKDHVKDTGSKGVTGHNGTDGSSPFDRMNRYGKWSGGAGENIAYGSETGRKIVIQLLVDDGVSSRGHRKNILKSDFSRVGIGFGSHSVYGNMCVQTFANGYAEKEK
jgi:uncharacterized protein YkwD